MQAASDIFLGSHRIDGPDGRPHDYYVRQLKDWKGSAQIERDESRDAQAYGQLCGITLARAHARSGDRIAMAAYLGKGDSFDRALARFATDYAARNAKTTRHSVRPSTRAASSPPRGSRGLRPRRSAAVS